MKNLSATAIVLGIALILATLLLPIEAKSDIEPVAEVKEDPAIALQAHVELVADAILEAEGRCGHGQSGEYGCFQYQAGTWAAYSRLISGKVLTQTEANERYITEGMIKQWILDGKTDRWIFLQWNQGNGDGWGPGLKDCYEGWNDWGVHYDSCDYARRGLEYLEKARASTPGQEIKDASVLP